MAWGDDAAHAAALPDCVNISNAFQGLEMRSCHSRGVAAFREAIQAVMVRSCRATGLALKGEKMIWVVAGISFLAGMIGSLIASVLFVLCFSFAAATMIAVYSLILGGSVDLVLAAWLATIVAMQTGFALSMLTLAALQSGKAATSRDAIQERRDQPRART